MLTNKIQKYIFNRLLKGQGVSYEVLDQNKIAFTDGVCVYILSKDWIKFDVTCCTPSDKLRQVLSWGASGEEVRPAEEIRINDLKGKTYRKLVSVDGMNEVWIEDSFVKAYHTCTFIWHPYETVVGPVCVIDDYGELIAGIMPMDFDGSLKGGVTESDS